MHNLKSNPGLLTVRDESFAGKPVAARHAAETRPVSQRLRSHAYPADYSGTCRPSPLINGTTDASLCTSPPLAFYGKQTPQLLLFCQQVLLPTETWGPTLTAACDRSRGVEGLVPCQAPRVIGEQHICHRLTPQCSPAPRACIKHRTGCPLSALTPSVGPSSGCLGAPGGSSGPS